MSDMAPLPPTAEQAQFTHQQAILFGTFSLLVAILIFPPLTWHFRNRNVGATVLVACAFYANFISFVNAMIWSNDDPSNWFSGIGLCDVEVKLQMYLMAALPAAISCILRALARVMDTERSTWGMTKNQKKRGYAIDLTCCVGIPLLQIPGSWIVQPVRYYVFGITGCHPALSISWPMLLLVMLQPLLWTLLAVYYSVLVVARLIRYRLQFRSILANNRTTKSRFLRLYVLCAILAFGYLPLHVYLVISTIAQGFGPFDWNDVHHPTAYDWTAVVRVSTHGHITYDGYIWMAGGVVIFLIFGLGKDAVRMYRDGLLACGAGRIWPSLRNGSQRGSGTLATMSSMSSRARMLFSKRKGSVATHPSTMDSFDSTKSITDSETSPKKMSFLDTIQEGGRNEQRIQSMLRWTTPPSSPIQEKAPWNRLSSYFKRDQAATKADSRDHFVLSQIATQTRVESNVTAEPVSPTMESHIRNQSRGNADVLIRKEVRQNSETAPSISTKDFYVV